MIPLEFQKTRGAEGGNWLQPVGYDARGLPTVPKAS